MTNPVAIYREEVKHDDTPNGAGIWVWCPGCDQAHRPKVVSMKNLSYGEGALWDWNKDLENLTITPSLLVHMGELKKCHSFIRNGNWEFLGDSWHELAGQTVPLPPVPDWLV